MFQMNTRAASIFIYITIYIYGYIYPLVSWRLVFICFTKKVLSHEIRFIVMQYSYMSDNDPIICLVGDILPNWKWEQSGLKQVLYAKHFVTRLTQSLSWRTEYNMVNGKIEKINWWNYGKKIKNFHSFLRNKTFFKSIYTAHWLNMKKKLI